ncbi:MAG: glycosyltransferase, partial [Longimicrobiales bacterium]
MRGLPLTGARSPKRQLLWCTEWVACRLAHRVLCVSHSVRHEAIQSGICHGGKIAVLRGGSGNGVDARARFNPELHGGVVRAATRARFGIPADAVVAGFVGRIVRDKGIIELAGAWGELRARCPTLHLLLVGPLEPQDPIPAEVERLLRADERVHFAGMDWDTPPFYAAMDLVVLPTYREGFPNVALEAAAMGLPVIATRVPGCIDAVADGVTGTLAAVRDVDSLAAAIARYASDGALRHAHGSAGRKRVIAEFGQEGVWAALFEEYARLLGGLRRGHGAALEATDTRPRVVAR